jgi:hypothetical protein
MFDCGSGGFIHQDAGFLGPQYCAVAFGDGQPPENLQLPSSLTQQDADDRAALQQAASARYARGRRPRMGAATSYVYEVARTLMKRQDLFDTTKFAPRDVERMARTSLPLHAQARKMLEAGVHP